MSTCICSTHDEPFQLPYYFGTGSAPVLITKQEECGNGSLPTVPHGTALLLPQQQF
jgi:hypothetical protein